MYWCTECKKQCKGIVVDFGIGSYEYWGQRCVDTNKQLVSECCEAEVSTTEAGHSIYSYEDMRADAKADHADAIREMRDGS